MKVQLRSQRSALRVARPTPMRPRGASPETAEHNRQAVAQALGRAVQPKLMLGRSDDPQEAQADRVAAQVMRGAPTGGLAHSSEGVQRQCAECEEEQRKKEPPADEQAVQRKAAGQPAGAVGASVPAATAAGIAALRGGGSTLPPSERSFFEPRFGASLGHVRVHADGPSAVLSGQLQARAFTVGPDIFFGAGEFRPGTVDGRHLLAHELTHVLQQSGRHEGVVRRWQVGAAPAPAGLDVVTDAEQLRRLDQAEGIVRGVVGSTRCRNFFRDNCTNGAGAPALQRAFDNARIYLRPVDDNEFGLQPDPNRPEIAFNLRAFRIGRFMMASTLLHEMFHTCDPTTTGRAAEVLAEDAVERCRAYTPWIDRVTPRRAAAGAQVTIRGWGFGGAPDAGDEVRLNGVAARVVSWGFMADTSSRVEIVVELPADAASGSLVVVNNRVQSNAVHIVVA